MEINSEIEFGFEEAFSDFMKTRENLLKPVENKPPSGQSLDNILENQPSTSGLCTKKEVHPKVVPSVANKPKTKRRRKDVPYLNKKPVAVEKAYSPPVTRNYAKLTEKQLERLAKRIKIFHEDGIVLAENMDDVVPCKNKRKPLKTRTNKVNNGQRVLGTRFGNGTVGVGCSNYGVKKCACCNIAQTKLPEIKEKEVIQEFESPIFCSSFGINNCACCPDSNLNNLDEEMDIVDVEHLSVSQMPSNDNVVVDSSGCVNTDDSTDTVKPPTISLPKHKILKKFLDSFTHERVDYSKPEQQNIVESVIHNPVTYYSENLYEDVDAPETNILERVDFRKEQERLARLSRLLYTPQAIQSLRSFTESDLCATSTPKIVMKPVETALSPIEGDISVDSPEKPTEGVEPINICYTNDEIVSVHESDHQNIVKKEPFLLDFSVLDTSRVTIRTPYKPRMSPLENDPEAGEEESLMDFVNNLFVEDEDAIVQECQMRCQRIIENQHNAYMAYSNAVDAINLVDDMGDNAVQIVDNPIELLSDTSDVSVQFIADESRHSSSDVQIVDFPSTSSHCRRKRKIKQSKKTNENVVHNLEDEPPDQTTQEQPKTGVQECSICLEPLHRAKGVSSTYCGHLFCTPCITSTIKTIKKCPMCRKTLNLKKIHPVYMTF